TTVRLPPAWELDGTSGDSAAIIRSRAQSNCCDGRGAASGLSPSGATRWPAWRVPIAPGPENSTLPRATTTPVPASLARTGPGAAGEAVGGGERADEQQQDQRRGLHGRSS